jgi:hypothetical protein
MDSTIWGPHYWFVLHTIAFHYPIHPTTIVKKIHHRFIHNLHEFLPNKTIATTFEKMLHKYPVTPYLDTRDDFIKWMHFMHNKMNERLEKPTISLSDHYVAFKQHFETRPHKLKRLWNEKRKVLFTLFSLLFIALLYINCPTKDIHTTTPSL